ncbi:MAG: ribonuclease PH [bacterium]
MYFRPDARAIDALRPITIEFGYLSNTPGSVLYRQGRTWILATATVELGVPRWMENKAEGWITAEYNMIPAATRPRKAREQIGKQSGRSLEIQRLVGRALRAVADLSTIPNRTIYLDCEVLQADGGTRCASINAAYLALMLAVSQLMREEGLRKSPIREPVGAISVGLMQERGILDMSHQEDSMASVDMNLVMTASGKWAEIQGTGEGAAFDDFQLQELLRLGKAGILSILAISQAALNEQVPNLLLPTPA